MGSPKRKFDEDCDPILGSATHASITKEVPVSPPKKARPSLDIDVLLQSAKYRTPDLSALSEPTAKAQSATSVLSESPWYSHLLSIHDRVDRELTMLQERQRRKSWMRRSVGVHQGGSSGVGKILEHEDVLEWRKVKMFVETRKVMQTMDERRANASANEEGKEDDDDDLEKANGMEKEKARWVVRVYGTVTHLNSQTLDDSISFMSCLDKVEIRLDPEQYEQGCYIEWKRPAHSANTNTNESHADGIEIQRTLPQRPFGLHLTIHMRQQGEEHFEVTGLLSKLVGKKYASKSFAIQTMWSYIKIKGLQCLDDKSEILLDDYLQNVADEITGKDKESKPVAASIHPSKNASGKRSMPLAKLLGVIDSFLKPIPPVEIHLPVGPEMKEHSIAGYELLYRIHDKSRMEPEIPRVSPFGTFSVIQAKNVSNEENKNKDEDENSTLDEQAVFEELEKRRHRRNMLLACAAAPRKFCLDLLQIQDALLRQVVMVRDQQLMHNDSAFYNKRWIHSAVPRYLIRKELFTKEK